MGQVGHLNLDLDGALIIFVRAFLLITCPQTNIMGGLSLVATSFVTGQMKMLWNLKSFPKSTSVGNSLLWSQSWPFKMGSTFANFGRAYALA